MTPSLLPRPGRVQLALSAPVVKRALKFAVVVGAILIAINHGDVIVSGEISAERWLKMGLTVIVPYCVSTLSSVEAMRRDAGSGVSG